MFNQFSTSHCSKKSFIFNPRKFLACLRNGLVALHSIAWLKDGMIQFRQNPGRSACFFPVVNYCSESNFSRWFIPFCLLAGRGLFLAGGVILSVASPALAQPSVTLAWNAATNSAIAGYRVYRGGASHAYTNNINAGNTTQTTLTGLAAGATYFFAVTAYTGAGAESDFSAELQY